MTTIDLTKLPSKEDLKQHGLIQFHFPFPPEFAKAALASDWENIDRLISRYLENGGLIHTVISQYQPFNFSEHIIAIREAATDEDGIWHDDGSREIAFTWSLNDDKTLDGGELLFRKKGSEKIFTIIPPNKETFIIFLTGKSGFEHKVSKVISGQRKTIAGWCSLEKPSWL